MRPKKPETTGSTDLFRARLDQIINLKHELAQLAGKIDWDWIDGEIAPLYSDKGRPGIGTRFAIGLLLLKHIYGLSDEGACDRWVHDPYFQYFTGERLGSDKRDTALRKAGGGCPFAILFISSVSIPSPNISVGVSIAEISTRIPAKVLWRLGLLGRG